MANNAKVYRYSVELRKRKGSSPDAAGPVTVVAGYATIDSRGNLYFTTKGGQGAVIAAFHDGSWLSVSREEVLV